MIPLALETRTSVSGFYPAENTEDIRVEKREPFPEGNDFGKQPLEIAADLMAVEEFEIEELSVDGICGVY